MLYHGERLSVSSIGHTIAQNDGLSEFSEHRQLIAPLEIWELYGCEDPRVTKVGDTYYIFYTALGFFPFQADGIRVAVAKTKDFKTIDERYLVTPFNAKAMALFPEKVNGKWSAFLTVNSDQPPAKMALVQVDKLEDLWNEDMWVEWYTKLDDNSIDLRRHDSDHVEVGAPPIKTNYGWLLVYSHIQNYFDERNRVFGIDTVLLDLDDPTKVISRTRYPFMVPEESYEQYGQVANIVFPSGAFVRDDQLTILYGACDTVCCSATIALPNLIRAMSSTQKGYVKRYNKNPILEPVQSHAWESKYVLNPTAIDIDETVHILYRALGEDMTSVIGYAKSKDGVSIDYRSDQPIYVPREKFEQRIEPDVGSSGCEDARITRIDDRLHITYTAYNGRDEPNVAISSITVKDFQNENWSAWSKPYLISPPGIDDKDAAIFPEKVSSDYMILHRIDRHICADFTPSLDFSTRTLTRCIQILGPRKGMWDSEKVGISGPPFKTNRGWVMFYHGISTQNQYSVGAVLLDEKDPTVLLARSAEPVMEPYESYEREGWIKNVVFPCGQVLRNETVYLYYGGADQVVCVATINLDDLLRSLE